MEDHHPIVRQNRHDLADVQRTHGQVRQLQPLTPDDLSPAGQGPLGFRPAPDAATGRASDPRATCQVAGRQRGRGRFLSRLNHSRKGTRSRLPTPQLETLGIHRGSGPLAPPRRARSGNRRREPPHASHPPKPGKPDRQRDKAARNAARPGSEQNLLAILIVPVVAWARLFPLAIKARRTRSYFEPAGDWDPPPGRAGLKPTAASVVPRPGMNRRG